MANDEQNEPFIKITSKRSLFSIAWHFNAFVVTQTVVE